MSVGEGYTALWQLHLIVFSLTSEGQNVDLQNANSPELSSDEKVAPLITAICGTY